MVFVNTGASATSREREVILGRRQLFMLPTRNGLLFVVILVVLLLAAINYSNGLAYALTFLLGALAVVSMLYTHRNLYRLRISPGACAPVFVGQVAVFNICLINSHDTPRLGVRVLCNKTEIASVDLGANQSHTVELRVPAKRRGYLSAPRFIVSTRFPLGLLYSWSRRLQLDQDCLVYPKPAPPQLLRASASDSTQHAQGLRAGGDDFVGLREFHAGDSPHHVDWKAVARGLGWYIKQFGGGAKVSTWLEWDALEGMATEARLSVLCRWVLDAEEGGLHYGLRLPGETIAPGSGEAHQHRCLKALAVFDG